MTEKNVVELLVEQHDKIREMFATVESAKGNDRQQAFEKLRQFLAVHETAEEMVVHPSARRHGAGEVVESRLAEEHEAKEVLSDLDGMSVDDPGFDDRFRSLMQMVLAHAESEENEEFPRLLEEASSAELKLMQAAVQAAEAVAPTHPHPGVESAIANTAVGPIASLIDRTRDAVGAVIGQPKG
jgi:hemerythrin superfamily protein